MDTNTNYTTKVRVLLVAFAVFFGLLIFFLYALTREKPPINLLNSSSSHDRLSNEDLKLVRDQLSGYLSSEIKTADIAIRWSSFVDDGDDKYFLVDIDALKQTYLVSMIEKTVLIDCPQVSQSKYPNSYCYVPGVDYGSTTDVVLGDMIPYDGEINGIEYQVDAESNDGELTMHIFDCQNDEIETAVTDDFNKILEDKGVDTDLFYYDVEFNYCEDDE